MNNPNIICNLRDLTLYASSRQLLTRTNRALQLLQLSLRTPSNVFRDPVQRKQETQRLVKIFSQSRNLLTHPIGNAAANAIQKVNSKVGKRSSSAHLKTNIFHDF